MTKETVHIIGNEFTRGISHPEEWWQHRIRIWENFTLASLQNQTNKNFVLLMLVDNAVPLSSQEDILRILEQSELTYVICNIKTDEIGEKLSYLQNFDKYQYVLHTRIDSDDLFHKDVVDEIQTYSYEGRTALIFQKGYCYDCANKKLQHYKMPSPPFSTIGFPIEEYATYSRWNEYLKITGHDTVINRMPYSLLSENKYIVLVHGGNLDTIYNTDEKLNRLDISESEHENILKDFGITSNTFEKITI